MERSLPIQQFQRELVDKLAAILAELQRLTGFAPLQRIAVAAYDEDTDLLWICGHAGESDFVLDEYECLLGEVPSLAMLAAMGKPRVVDDMEGFGNDGAAHTQALRRAGFRSSLTVPIIDGDLLEGFLFFNALEPGFFSPQVVEMLQPCWAPIFKLVHRYGGQVIQSH